MAFIYKMTDPTSGHKFFQDPTLKIPKKLSILGENEKTVVSGPQGPKMEKVRPVCILQLVLLFPFNAHEDQKRPLYSIGADSDHIVTNHL